MTSRRSRGIRTGSRRAADGRDGLQRVGRHVESRVGTARSATGLHTDSHQGPLSKSTHVDATAIEAQTTATAADHRL